MTYTLVLKDEIEQKLTPKSIRKNEESEGCEVIE